MFPITYVTYFDWSQVDINTVLGKAQDYSIYPTRTKLKSETFKIDGLKIRNEIDNLAKSKNTNTYL